MKAEQAYSAEDENGKERSSDRDGDGDWVYDWQARWAVLDVACSRQYKIEVVIEPSMRTIIL